MSALPELIKQSSYCVALTGAGISTLSGIPDFRGKNGIYQKFDSTKIFDLDYFLSDPSYYYTVSKDFIYNIDNMIPNIIHKELSRLESIGVIKSVITQNIDLLHTRAGSKKVFELHGSPVNHTCLNCGKRFDFQTIAAIVNSNKVPYCTKCNGIVKPDIIFFGESLDTQTLDNAINECIKADLILALGTSLVVQPAASLPMYCIRKGGTLIIVNDTETPLDTYAYRRYPDLETTFNEICGLI